MSAGATTSAGSRSGPGISLREHLNSDWFRWTLIALACLYAFLAGFKTVGDFDLGWQLATGRYIAQHHVIPSTDVFSYTANGNPWIYPPFSGLFFYLLYQLNGYAALSWLGAAACVTAIFLAARGGSSWSAFLAILAVPAVAFRTIPRAELFTTVLFAAFAGILWAHRDGRASRLWLLPVLMAFWVNLHTGFIAGLALIGAYLLAEAGDLFSSSRRLAVIQRIKAASPWLGLSAVATLANPWGWRIYQAIERQSAVSKLHGDFIGEWSGVRISFNSLQQFIALRNPSSADWWMLFFAVVAILAAIALKDLGTGIVLLAGSVEAVQHIRFQAVFALLVCIVGGSVLGRAWEKGVMSPRGAGEPRDPFAFLKPRARLVQAIAIALVFFFVAVRGADLVTQRYYLSSGQISLFGSGLSWWFPERATQFLDAQHLPGNVFGDYNLGGYLTWRLGPERPDYFDGRFIPFGASLFVRHRKLVELPLDDPEWQKEADARNIQTVIFSVARFAGLGNFPLQADCLSHNWKPVFFDDAAIIFVRDTPANASLLERLAIRCDAVQFQPPSTRGFFGWRPAAERYEFLMNVASIDYVLSRDAEAAQAMDEAQRIFSADSNLYLLRAQFAEAHGDLSLAELDYRQSLSLNPSDDAWFALANLYARQKLYEQSLDALLHSRDLSRQEYDRDRSLGKLYLLMGRPTEALAAFDDASRLSPFRGPTAPLGSEFNARVAEGKADALLQLGRVQDAIAAEKEAIAFTPLVASRWEALSDLYVKAGESGNAQQAHAQAVSLEPGPSAVPATRH
ncbi:MAG TPA: tetratricopeptide repeat protein [Verrucomicrobiae bacterium]|nr:tetratricopeptide repeat protein [Verrucomicrobiae bacterium]